MSNSFFSSTTSTFLLKALSGTRQKKTGFVFTTSALFEPNLLVLAVLGRQALLLFTSAATEPGLSPVTEAGDFKQGSISCRKRRARTCPMRSITGRRRRRKSGHGEDSAPLLVKVEKMGPIKVAVEVTYPGVGSLLLGGTGLSRFSHSVVDFLVYHAFLRYRDAFGDCGKLTRNLVG